MAFITREQPMADNIFKRGSTYWLEVRINGKRIRESLHTNSMAIAKKEARARIEILKGQVYRGSVKVTWLQAVTDWTKHIEKHVGAKSAKRYAISLKQCAPYLTPLTIQSISGKVIADLITGRAKDGASNATIKRDLTAISSVFEYAIGREWVEINPTLAKRRLIRERREPIVLPIHEAIEFYIAAAGPRFGAFIRAAWLTGCRQDELAKAKWADFNEVTGTLEVIGKGRKRRVIKLYSEARAFIAKQPRGGDTIFSRNDGKAIEDAATLFTHLRRAIMHKAEQEARTVQRFRFHDLRHLFAVEALQNGRMGIYELSRHLGHTSVKTTEIYLAFLTPEQASKAAGPQIGPQADESALQISLL